MVSGCRKDLGATAILAVPDRTSRSRTEMLAYALCYAGALAGKQRIRSRVLTFGALQS